MSSSFDFDQLQSFSAGTIGPPGQRVFFLQAASTGEIVSLRLEKQLVAALADAFEVAIANYDVIEGDGRGNEVMEPLQMPVVAEWVVGGLGVAYDPAERKIVVMAEELTDADDPAKARFCLDRRLLIAFTHGARAVLDAGRPTCPLCDRPVDPDGHFCPRMN